MVSMAQSVDLSIATVIEHVGKNCVPQTKNDFNTFSSSGTSDNDYVRVSETSNFGGSKSGELWYKNIFSVYLKRAPRILEEIGAIFIMFSGMLIPLVKFCKSLTKKSSSQPWNCDLKIAIRNLRTTRLFIPIWIQFNLLQENISYCIIKINI